MYNVYIGTYKRNSLSKKEPTHLTYSYSPFLFLYCLKSLVFKINISRVIFQRSLKFAAKRRPIANQVFSTLLENGLSCLVLTSLLYGVDRIWVKYKQTLSPRGQF